MAKKRSDSFRTAVNIISSIGVLILNICISFFLSPYIIRTIGVEANGFVNLANSFIAYADLVVTALNAMAARYITLAYVKKDYSKANLYYNSVFWGNLIIVGVLLIPATILIVRLELFMDVPDDILFDVKMLFALAFFAFFARTAAPNWDCGAQVRNRADRSSIASIFTAIIRCIILVCMFSVLIPHVWYVGVATVSTTLLFLVVQAYNTHTLTPELQIRIRKPICSFAAIVELVGSGVWTSVAIAGNTLMSGVDLLICNAYLGATLMGVLSVSKSIPNILVNFSETIRGALGPEVTIAYAKGDKLGTEKCIIKSLKLSAVIVTIPTAGIIVMSDALYSLWVPTQDAKLLQALTILAILRYIFSSGTVNLNTVFVTVNKAKVNAIAFIITGIVSIVITMLLIICTDLDLFAVAGVSSIVMIIRDLCFMIPITAKLLGLKWNAFYSQVGVSALCSGLIIAVGIVVRQFMPVNTWASFFGACFIIGAIGLVINMMVVLNKEERAYLIGIVKRKLKR